MVSMKLISGCRSGYRIILLILVLALVMVSGTAAQDISLSFQHWSFLKSGTGSISSPGQHVSAGVTAGINSRIELQAGLAGMLTPLPGDTVLGVLSVGYAMMGERRVSERIPPANWVNMLAELGVLAGWTGIRAASPDDPKAQCWLFGRITPFTLGNSFYGRRDRVLAFGLAWSPMQGTVSLLFNIMGIDIALRR